LGTSDLIDITKPRYRRIGECNRCGECCINEECRHLSIDDGIATCTIYRKWNREKKCRVFPANPPIVFKKCSYKFYDTWEDRIIGVGEV